MMKDDELYCYIAFTKPRDDTGEEIEGVINNLFGTGYDFVSDYQGECVFSITKPILQDPKLLQEFFEKLDKLFIEFEELQPHFTQFKYVS